MPREKTVYKAGQVAHLWAHQSQQYARTVAAKGTAGRFGYGAAVNPAGTCALSFDGPILISYQTPVAMIHKTRTGNVALLTSDKFSVTTSAQLSDARQACSGVLPVFTVPHIGLAQGASYGRGRRPVTGWRVQNRAFLAGRYAARVAELLASRRGPYADDSYEGAPGVGRWTPRVFATLDRIAREVFDYCDAFGLKAPSLNPTADAQRIATAKAATWDKHAAAQIVRDAERNARYAAARARWDADREAERLSYPEKVVKWRAGELSRLSRPYDYETGNATPGALLRVSRDGQNVETSQGAEVPVADARRAVAFVASKRGDGWARNGERFPVGAFQLDSIDTDGNVRAGCHYIEWSEVVHLSELLKGAA